MAINIGKLFDIKINLHFSWFIIVFILAWSLATNYFPPDYPDLTTSTYWILGGVAGVLLFACVLAHELSHALVAKKRGLEVEGITLFFFGGVANASEEGMTPGKEFQVAIAGPIMSIFLGVLFYVINLISFPNYITAVLEYLYLVNFVLAAFNMLPGFPLDGGRVFRSIVWKYTGDLRKATRYASNIGRAFGGLMMLAGFYYLFTGGAGLWYILLGGFLYLLAKASYDQVLLKEELGSKRVRTVMQEQFEKVELDESIENFVELFKKEQGPFVASDRDRFYIIDFDKIQSMERQDWPVKQVRDAAVKIKPAREGHKAWKSLLNMQKNGITVLPVAKNDKITGVLILQNLIAAARS